jgi:hypothetical protein
VPDDDGDRVAIMIDCEEGLRLGCSVFCCRLLVRLGPRDPPAYDAEGRRKSCVDKDPKTGLCIHLDPDTHRCRVWSQRPWVCRRYDCNEDALLQVVLREGFVSLTRLVTARPTSRRGPACAVPRLEDPSPREPQSASGFADNEATSSAKARL